MAYITSGAFTAATAGKDVVYTSAAVGSTGDNDILVSPAITNMRDMAKVPVGFEVTTAFAAVAADFGIQGSFDGETWVLLEELDADTNCETPGVQVFLADLSVTNCPFYRLVFNDGELDVLATGRITFSYVGDE
tara:strand:- start:663 stop:1064 length:402 start_codon:yes stop_codon:yes gene_type:complete